MKVVIVAKTRMGSGACVGGVTFGGQSVRLIAADAEINERFNLEYEIGDVWDIEYVPDPASKPPHVENIVVQKKTKCPPIEDLELFIEKQMPPVSGGVEFLYEGLAQATGAGVQYISARTGIPSYSTMFWRPDKPLVRCEDSKRIRYRYPTGQGGRTLTFVGFQEPLEEIPAGTLLRVSLAHWWRPDEKPDYELRCYVQLSGWYQLLERAPDSGKEGERHDIEIVSSDFGLDDAQEALEQVFGHHTFRPLQSKIINNVLQKRDSLAIMPTGSGKSLCYQLPAVLFPGLTVVVSPLIALMQDQVEQLRQLGIPAEYLNSSLSHQAYVKTLRKVRSGSVKLLYAAPETLLRPETLLLLQDCDVDCLTIDEAHCISQWGHDFRPEYRQLIDLRRRVPHAACLAVTATATKRVRQDIKATLQINSADEFVASFDRENLFLAAKPRQDGLEQVLRFLNDHHDEAGIIYCNTKKEVDRLVGELQDRGWPALPYHADLDTTTRQRNQRKFVYEDNLIMVATIAFGMGINKSNVRFVVHLGLPKNIESYYQQIGRAGRDGLDAACLLLHSRQDLSTIQFFIAQQSQSQQRGARLRTRAMLKYAETSHCRRPPLLAYFGETAAGETCGMCDNCIADQSAGTDDITIAAQKFLSCVARTDQIFGARHIINVLRGSRSKKVLQRGHDQLSTYGIGREYSTRQWQELANQLVQLGLLRRDLQYGSLQLTNAGQEVLRGAQVHGQSPGKKQFVSRSEGREFEEDFDRTLFELLREKRLQLATNSAVPPYVIFSDRSLVEMATYFPQTASAFAQINGVGSAKLERYANEFLPIISSYCVERGLSEKPPRGRKRAPAGISSRTAAVGEALNSGRSLSSIADELAIKEQTVINHLLKFVQLGGFLDSSKVSGLSRLNHEDRGRVFDAFTVLGTEFLRPIYVHLNEQFSYDELRILQLIFVVAKQEC